MKNAIITTELAERVTAAEPKSIDFTRYGFGAWSFSKAKVLRACPLQFYMKYVTKTKMPTAPMSLVTEVGKAAHRILEHSISGKSIDDSFKITKEEYSDKLAPHWENEVETLELSITTFMEKLSEFEKKNPVKRYLQEIRIGLTDTWKPTTFFAENVFYRGVIDLCIQLENRDLVIIDHKTGAPSIMGLKNFMPQLNGYKVMFHHGVERVTGASSGIHYIREGVTKVGDFSTWEEIEGKHLHSMSSDLDVKLDFVKDLGYFKHIAGNHCKYCDYAADCKAGKLKELEKDTIKFFPKP